MYEFHPPSAESGLSSKPMGLNLSFLDNRVPKSQMQLPWEMLEDFHFFLFSAKEIRS